MTRGWAIGGSATVVAVVANSSLTPVSFAVAALGKPSCVACVSCLAEAGFGVLRVCRLSQMRWPEAMNICCAKQQIEVTYAGATRLE
jgi:hypothetical protein